MATTYIQFTGRLKATSQEGILAEAQQVAVSSTDSTDIKTYIDNKIKEVQGNIGSVAGSVYRPKGSLTVANFKALTSAAVGDVYNITEQFTLSGRTYPAYTNVACVKAFSSAVTPDDSYWDALGGTVDLTPYAKTADVNTKVDTINKSISDNVSSLTTKISTAQSTANTANDTANTNKTSISGLTTRVSTLEGSDHVNKINTVKVNGTALTVDSNKAVNIDLSGKVDKVTGKGLSTNDFTAAYKSKLDGIAAGANAYVLPTATKDTLGGVKVNAVDDGTITSYQGANTTLRNGRLMCDLVSDSQNGALSKTDYTAFKKTGTDLAALDTRVTSAEDDINQLFSDKADASDLDKRIEEKVHLGHYKNDYQYDGVTLSYGESTDKVGVTVMGSCVELQGDYGDSVTHLLRVRGNVHIIDEDGSTNSDRSISLYQSITIGTEVSFDIQDKNVKLGYGVTIEPDAHLEAAAHIGNHADIGDNVLIGTNAPVKIMGGLGIGLVEGNLYYGDSNNPASNRLAKYSDVTSLQSRVTALENLLKLA